MNAAFHELRLPATYEDQIALRRAAEGIERYDWDSQFGSILIEVIEGKTFVSGELVEPITAECP